MQLTDEQKYEARSMRYVEAARVVQLSDGTFVVYSMTSGEEVGATPDTNEIAALVAVAVERSSSYWAAARQVELAHAAERQERPQRGVPPTVQVADVSLEDLGL